MAATHEILKQIDAVLDLSATYRAKSKYDDLSDRDDRSVLTEVNTVLEMLAHPDTAASGPADVYSLAKSLWVFLTGQKYPLQGEVRVDNPRDRLSEYTEHPRLGQLDLLIEHSTRRDPVARPSMQEFHDELRAWLSPPEPDQGAADLGYLKGQVEGMLAPGKREIEQYQAIQQRFEDAVGSLNMGLFTVRERLKELGFELASGSCGQVFRPEDQTVDEANIVRRQGEAVCAHLLDHDRVLWAGVQSLRLHDELGQHEAAYILTDAKSYTFLRKLWSASRSAPIGSAQEATATTDLHADFVRQLGKMVESLIEEGRRAKDGARS